MKHPRWEAFAQAYVRCKNGTQAAKEVGFKGGKDGNNFAVRAHELLKKPEVQKRVSELNQQLVKETMKSAKVDRAWVLDRLKENAQEALENRDRAAANRALELLGKELGLFIDRKMVLTGPLEALDAPRLQRLLALAQAAEEGRLVLPKSIEMPKIESSSNSTQSSDPIDKSGEILDLEAVDVPETAEPVPEALEEDDDDVLG